MKKFRDFLYDVVCEDAIVAQGGNAFPDVSPIDREYIFPVLKDFYNTILFPALKVPATPDAFFALGSTGKKPQSGDIDVCVNSLALGTPMREQIRTVMGYALASTGIKCMRNPVQPQMLQFAFPVKQNGQLVQIDLLFTEYPVFVKWFMYSPEYGVSEYKAAHRNQLLRSVAKTMTMEVVKTLPDGEPATWRQQDVKCTGVVEGMQTIVDAEGNRLMYDDAEPLLPEYAKTITQVYLTHSPRKCCSMFLGADILPAEVDSFQHLLALLKSPRFKYPAQVDDILFECAKTLRKNSKLVFPKELEQYY